MSVSGFNCASSMLMPFCWSHLLSERPSHWASPASVPLNLSKKPYGRIQTSASPTGTRSKQVMHKNGQLPVVCSDKWSEGLPLFCPRKNNNLLTPEVREASYFRLYSCSPENAESSQGWCGCRLHISRSGNNSDEPTLKQYYSLVFSPVRTYSLAVK